MMILEFCEIEPVLALFWLLLKWKFIRIWVVSLIKLVSGHVGTTESIQPALIGPSDNSFSVLMYIQSNLNSSNTDGSFTMANSNTFFSPYEILLIAQEIKYLGKFSYFIMKLYVVCAH